MTGATRLVVTRRLVWDWLRAARPKLRFVATELPRQADTRFGYVQGGLQLLSLSTAGLVAQSMCLRRIALTTHVFNASVDTSARNHNPLFTDSPPDRFWKHTRQLEDRSLVLITLCACACERVYICMVSQFHERARRGGRDLRSLYSFSMSGS